MSLTLADVTGAATDDQRFVDGAPCLGGGKDGDLGVRRCVNLIFAGEPARCMVRREAFSLEARLGPKGRPHRADEDPPLSWRRPSQISCRQEQGSPEESDELSSDRCLGLVGVLAPKELAVA